MKRKQITVRSTDGRDREPWPLVRQLLRAFGWAVEAIDDVVEPGPAPAPSKTAAELEAERLAALTAFVEATRKEREGLAKVIAALKSAEDATVLEIENKAMPLTADGVETEQVN